MLYVLLPFKKEKREEKIRHRKEQRRREKKGAPLLLCLKKKSRNQNFWWYIYKCLWICYLWLIYVHCIVLASMFQSNFIIYKSNYLFEHFCKTNILVSFCFLFFSENNFYMTIFKVRISCLSLIFDHQIINSSCYDTFEQFHKLIIWYGHLLITRSVWCYYIGHPTKTTKQNWILSVYFTLVWLFQQTIEQKTI